MHASPYDMYSTEDPPAVGPALIRYVHICTCTPTDDRRPQTVRTPIPAPSPEAAALTALPVPTPGRPHITSHKHHSDARNAFSNPPQAPSLLLLLLAFPPRPFRRPVARADAPQAARIAYVGPSHPIPSHPIHPSIHPSIARSSVQTSRPVAQNPNPTTRRDSRNVPPCKQASKLCAVMFGHETRLHTCMPRLGPRLFIPHLIAWHGMAWHGIIGMAKSKSRRSSRK